MRDAALRYPNILFDLDGTLTDPREGITRSVQFALARLGIDEPDLARLEHFIGPPLLQCFMQTYGFDEARAWEAVNHYRERFRVTGLYENRVFDGIPEACSKPWSDAATRSTSRPASPACSPARSPATSPSTVTSRRSTAASWTARARTRTN